MGHCGDNFLNNVLIFENIFSIMNEDEQWLLLGLVIGFFVLVYKGIYLPNKLYFDGGQWKFDLFLWLLLIATTIFSILIIFLCVQKIMRYKKASYIRHRARGFSCSDQLWERIQTKTKGAISASTYIRKAVERELENG